jgi:hypothetical protein
MGEDFEVRGHEPNRGTVLRLSGLTEENRSIPQPGEPLSRPEVDPSTFPTTGLERQL